MDFLNSQEKIQLQQILTKSSQLQTSDERRNFLIFCGLEDSCGLVPLDQPLSKFVISLCSTLSKVYITVEDSEKLGLIVFLEYINKIESSLSTNEQDFIQHVITRWEQWQASKTRTQQSKQSTSPSPQATIISSQNLAEAEAEAEQTGSQNTPTAHLRQDWGEAPDISIFFGRTKELTTLEQWVVQERCRLVAILGMKGMGKTRLSLKLGMGGIGKTDLLLKLAQGIQGDFEYVIWRSLLNAPPVIDVLADLIKFLSNQQEIVLPDTLDGKISRLLYYLRKHRCLLILDNLESILRGGARAGQYREEYDGYGQLLDRVGEVSHQSCLILTSREKPQEIARLEGKTRPVRSLELNGLNNSDGRKVFTEVGSFYGSDDEWKELIDLYNGNPLVLDLAAKHIKEVFLGNISEFLIREKPVFDDLRDLLDWHFERLSILEKDIMYWLAVNREPVSLSELIEDILSSLAKERVPATLQSLGRKLPLERSTSGFKLQPVLIEYVIERFVEQVSEEIWTGEIALFNSHALLKAQAQDFVREAQIRCIIKPILEEVFIGFCLKKDDIKSKLKKILLTLQQKFPLGPGYAGGNVLNLLVQFEGNLSGYDFSYLTIWQAYLQGVNLHHVNFFHAELGKSIFTKTLGSVLSVAFSSDGQLLATGDANGQIYLWQVADSKQILTCEGHTSWVRSIAFSPNGEILASGSSDYSVKLWNVSNGQCLTTLKGHSDQVYSVTFSPDGKILVSGSEDLEVRVWDVIFGRYLRTVHKHDSRVRSVVFSPDGQILVTCDQVIRLWKASNWECVKTLREHTGCIRSVAFSSNGKILVSAGEDKEVKLWDILTEQCLITLQGHAARIWSVAFSPDGSRLASGGDDKTVRLWDISSGQNLKTLQGHANSVRSVAFSPDNRTLASGSSDQTVRLWDVRTGQCLRTLQGYANPIRAVTFSPDGSRLASGSNDHIVRLWSVNSGQSLYPLQGHIDCVQSVAFSPDGGKLASASDDSTVKLWDLKTRQCIATLKQHISWVWSIAFSPDGQILASASRDKVVILWDISTSASLRTLQDHNDEVHSVAFSPNGQILASGSDDHTVKLWAVSTGECLKTFDNHTNCVRSVVFSPDGATLASSSDDQTVKLWAVSTGECLKTLRGHGGRVRSLAFSPDGVILASSSDDMTVKLWAVSTEQCLGTLEGHTSAVWSVAFSPDGKTLASGSEDEKIKLWDINEIGKCLHTFRADRPYEGMNITGVTGLTKAQIATLIALGAFEQTGTP